MIVDPGNYLRFLVLVYRKYLLYLYFTDYVY